MKNNRSNYYYSVQITSKFSINMIMKNLKYICFKYFFTQSKPRHEWPLIHEYIDLVHKWPYRQCGVAAFGRSRA